MKNKALKYGIVILVILLIGFAVGRMTSNVSVKETVKTEYVKAPYAVYDTIDKPIPYAVEKTVYVPYEINGMDTLYIPVDTAVILSDYFLKRKYKLDFSNDTLGVFIVDASVSQNKLITATSTIQPIIRITTKEKTIYKVPTIQYFGIIGTSIDMGTNKAQFGVDIKQKYLLGLSGLRIKDSYGYTIDFGIKF